MTWIDDSDNNFGRPAFVYELQLSGQTLASVDYHEVADGAWQVLVSVMDASVALPSRKMTHEEARETAVLLAKALRRMWPEDPNGNE